MRVLQINVDRRRGAQDLLFQTAAREGIDLVSEPNKAGARKSNWFVDEKTDVCIINRSSNVKIVEWGKGPGFVWVKIDEIHVYCVYMSPNCTLTEYEAFLHNLHGSVCGKTGGILTGGNLNAKSPIWGAPQEDERGRILSEWLAAENILVSNVGAAPTFQRGDSKSIIDVTLITEDMVGKVEGWKVLEEETLSLHRYITFACWTGRTEHGKSGGRGKISMTRLAEGITRNVVLSAGLVDVSWLTEETRKEQDRAILRASFNKGGGHVYWWTEEIQRERGR